MCLHSEPTVPYLISSRNSTVAWYRTWRRHYVYLGSIFGREELEFGSVQFKLHIVIRKMSNKFPEVSQPQKPLETSENLRKPRKPHDLEIYVGFPGNLLERISVETYGNL